MHDGSIKNAGDVHINIKPGKIGYVYSFEFCAVFFKIPSRRHGKIGNFSVVLTPGDRAPLLCAALPILLS